MSAGPARLGSARLTGATTQGGDIYKADDVADLVDQQRIRRDVELVLVPWFETERFKDPTGGVTIRWAVIARESRAGSAFGGSRPG